MSLNHTARYEELKSSDSYGISVTNSKTTDGISGSPYCYYNYDTNTSPYKLFPDITPGDISVSTGIDDAVFGMKEVSGQDLVGMLIEGKDLEKDKDVFMDVIMRLPSVNRDNLKAIEVYERLRKFSKIINAVDLKKWLIGIFLFVNIFIHLI